METILVMGGAGFIGSSITDILINEEYKVVVVDNLSSGKKDNINPSAIFDQIDLSRNDLVEVFNNENINYVCHHAAQIDVRKSVSDPIEDATINIIGLLNLLQYCLEYKISGIVFASSG